MILAVPWIPTVSMASAVMLGIFFPKAYVQTELRADCEFQCNKLYQCSFRKNYSPLCKEEPMWSSLWHESKERCLKIPGPFRLWCEEFPVAKSSLGKAIAMPQNRKVALLVLKSLGEKAHSAQYYRVHKNYWSPYSLPHSNPWYLRPNEFLSRS